MYSGGQTNGNMGGLAGANASCAAAWNPAWDGGANYTQFKALLSTTTFDVINLNPPSTLPIVSPSDIQIAANWASLWDGNIDTTLEAAGILPAFVGWFSATLADGTYNSSLTDCAGWTNGTVDVVGAGSSSFTFSWWVEGAGFCDDSTMYLLCIAY